MNSAAKRVKKKPCVLCAEPYVGRLAMIYASGIRQGWRESEAGENIPVNDQRGEMCATHRRQLDEALVQLQMAGP